MQTGTSETRLDIPTRLADLSMIALSVVLGGGSIAMFVMLPSVHYLPMGWPDSRALAWDALLSLAFFVQHSGMIRRSFRARLAPAVPARYHGAAYSIVSGVVLALVVLLWQPSGTRIFALHGLARWTAQSLGFIGGALLVLSVVTLRGSFDLFGLGPIRAHLRGQRPRNGDFVVRGPYLWVRHPVYACIILIFWTIPDARADQLLLCVMWSTWIYVGARLEERDLVAEFGDAYRTYQRQVPMFVPWRGRVRLAGQDPAAGSR